jgi:hypothetical protein
MRWIEGGVGRQAFDIKKCFNFKIKMIFKFFKFLNIIMQYIYCMSFIFDNSL